MRPSSCWLLLLASVAPAQGVRPLEVPAAAGALGPNLTRSDSGVLLSWLEPTGRRRFALRFARLDGDRFGEPMTVVEGRDLFANWADFPIVAENGDRVLASWLKRGGGGHAYDIELALSSDRGKTWERLGPPHRDGTATEHGFVSILSEGDGFRLFWLDGRAMAKDELRMELRTAVVTDGIGPERVLDADVCTCCQTSAVRVGDRPQIVYRDHTDGEIRDISIVGRDEKWTEPDAVADDRWTIVGCPVNGPSIDAIGDTVAVAWYTAAEPKPRVQIAFSRDGGESFAEPIVIDDEEPVGRVAVASIDGGAAVCWLGTDGDESTVWLARVKLDGSVGERLPVATSSAARSSGFPRIVRQGDRLVLAWREVGERTGVRAAVTRIAGL